MNSRAWVAPVSDNQRVISTSGPVRLVFDRMEAVFNNRIVAPASANLGFVWSNIGDAACSDGIDNDDHIVLGNGRQDGFIDFPADPECVSLDDASEDKEGAQQRRPVVLAGELDGEGRLLIPASGIDIPTVWAWDRSASPRGDRVYSYEFEPVGGAIGTVNPFTGELSVHLRFRIRVSLEDAGRFTGPGEHCYVGSDAEPIAIRLTTIEAHSAAGLPLVRGSAYDGGTGAFKLVGYNVGDVAGAAECGAFGELNDVVSAAFGVPSASGNIRLTAVGRIEPIPRPDKGATPNMVRMPLELFPSDKPRERTPRTSVGVVTEPDRGAGSADAMSATKPELPATQPPTPRAPISVAPRAASARPDVVVSPPPRLPLPTSPMQASDTPVPEPSAVRPPLAETPTSPPAGVESPAPAPTAVKFAPSVTGLAQPSAATPPLSPLPTSPPAGAESLAPLLPAVETVIPVAEVPPMRPTDVPVPAIVVPLEPGVQPIVPAQVPGQVPLMEGPPAPGDERLFHAGPESHLVGDPAVPAQQDMADWQEGTAAPSTEPAQTGLPAAPVHAGPLAEQPGRVEIGEQVDDADEPVVPAAIP